MNMLSPSSGQYKLICALYSCTHVVTRSITCYRSCTQPLHQHQRTGTATRDEARHQAEDDTEDTQLRQQTVHQNTLRHVDVRVVSSDANIWFN